MLKRLFSSIREYKTATYLTLLFILGEAIIETLIPTTTADLINEVQNGSEMSEIIKAGLILTVMANE